MPCRYMSSRWGCGDPLESRLIWRREGRASVRPEDSQPLERERSVQRRAQFLEVAVFDALHLAAADAQARHGELGAGLDDHLA